jgi:kynurenine formamidase
MLIDLSHTVEHGMITYKCLPAPIVCDFLGRDASRTLHAPETEFRIGKFEMVANTGTYLDSPFHRYADGKDLSELPLDRLANPEAIVVRWDLGQGRAISSEVFEGRDVRGKAVLVHTGWSAHWRTDRYFEGHPFLTRDAAEHLRVTGPALVGIDSYNIDHTEDTARPVHTALLKSRDSNRGAHDGAGADTRRGEPVLCRSGEGQRDGDFSGASVWHRERSLIITTTTEVRSGGLAIDQRRAQEQHGSGRAGRISGEPRRARAAGIDHRLERF